MTPYGRIRPNLWLGLWLGPDGGWVLAHRITPVLEDDVRRVQDLIRWGSPSLEIPLQLRANPEQPRSLFWVIYYP
jgi:hypothetical protein